MEPSRPEKTSRRQRSQRYAWGCVFFLDVTELTSLILSLSSQHMPSADSKHQGNSSLAGMVSEIRKHCFGKINSNLVNFPPSTTALKLILSYPLPHPVPLCQPQRGGRQRLSQRPQELRRLLSPSLKHSYGTQLTPPQSLCF